MTWSRRFTTYEAWARRVRFPAPVIAVALVIIFHVPKALDHWLSMVLLALLFGIPGLVMLIRNFTIGYRGGVTGSDSGDANAATGPARQA